MTEKSAAQTAKEAEEFRVMMWTNTLNQAIHSAAYAAHQLGKTKVVIDVNQLMYYKEFGELNQQTLTMEQINALKAKWGVK